MAATGGVLTKFVEQMTPGDVFGFIGNQNTSELGKVLQVGRLSENAYMTGLIAQQAIDILKGLVETQRLSTEAPAPVHLMAIELAIKALTQLQQYDKETLSIEENDRELLDRISDSNSLIAQSLEKCHQSYRQMIPIVMAIENEEERMNMMRMHTEAYESAKTALVDMSRRNVEIATYGKIDPAFFQERAKQVLK
jgi:hypothetical protein